MESIVKHIEEELLQLQEEWLQEKLAKEYSIDTRIGALDDIHGVVLKPLSKLRQKMEKKKVTINDAQELFKLTQAYYRDFGTEISINGFPTKDKDEWISIRDERAIRRAIYKYMKDTNTKIEPKMILVYEHANKYHCHGIFRGIPNDCVDYIRRYCERICGRTEIKMVENQEAYINYMFKSYIPGLHTKIDCLEHFDKYDYVTIGF